MTERQHPIAPPPELVQQWATEYWGPFDLGEGEKYIATQAARWGADQELEACYEWLQQQGYYTPFNQLRTARRPKPSSLKEQALQGFKVVSQFVLDEWNGCADYEEFKKITDTVQRALEQLPE